MHNREGGQEKRRPQASAQPHRPTEPWLSSHPASNKQGNGYAPHPRENAPGADLFHGLRSVPGPDETPFDLHGLAEGSTPLAAALTRGDREGTGRRPLAGSHARRPMELPWDCAFSEIVQDARTRYLLGTCRPQLALGTPTAPVRSAARPGRRAATMGRKAN